MSLNSSNQPLSRDSFFKLSSCRVKINLCTKSRSSKECLSGDTTPTGSDEEEENNEENYKVFCEINWLKERMVELSESLKLQSLATKELKGESLKSSQQEIGKLAEDFSNFKCKMNESLEVENSKKVQDVANLRREIESMKNDNCRLSSLLHDIELKMDVAKENVCDQIRSIKNDLECVSNDKFDSQPSSCKCSEIMKK